MKLKNLSTDEIRGETQVRDLPLDFTTVYNQHFDEVLRWIRALGGPEADLEDLAQEVFVVVRRQLRSFDGGNLLGWLHKIARLTVRDHGRRAWFRRMFRGPKDVEFDQIEAVSVDPETLLVSREDRRLFYRLVGQMSELRRETFVLFEVQGMSCEEIAQIQNVPVGTVWTRLHHARREFVAKVMAPQPEKVASP